MPFIGKQPEVGAYSKLDAITTSATATYNLTLDSGAYYPTSANHLLVSLNGVMQAPQDSFTVSGSTIVFASTLASTDSIDFIMALGDVLDIGTPSDGTVTTAKIVDNSISTAKIQDDAITSAKIAGALTTTGTTGIGIGQEPHSTAALAITTTSQHIRMLNGAELGVLSVESDGNIQLWSHGDDATQFRTGGGAGVIAARIDADGLKFGTDTASSNALDDYEEGSWTPAFLPSPSSVVYGTAAGTYTKVGNTVTCNWMIVLTNKGSLGASVRIGGLPFTGLSAPSYQVGSFMSSNLDLDANERLTGMQYAGNQFIYLMIEQNDAALYQPSGTGFLNNDSSISGSITYMTTQ